MSASQSPMERFHKIFGSALRTDTLVLLPLLGGSYPAELSTLREANTTSVRRILDDLELGGVVASRPIARVRRVQLNPRWFAARELAALLERLGEGDPRLSGLSLQRRAHPRRPPKDR